MESGAAVRCRRSQGACCYGGAGGFARARDRWLTASRSSVCRHGRSWAGCFPVLKPFAPADVLWAQDIDFAVIQTRMYPQSIWAAHQCKRRGIPALVIDHSTGYMMHGGLTGALGRVYEHLACGSIRRCGFPFYGVSGDVCRWLQTFGIRAAGRLPNRCRPR